MGVPFYNISAPSIVSGMSGESEKKIRDVFEEAKVFFCSCTLCKYDILSFDINLSTHL
jgi:SpoVK/Ycf46/Vps4 family AAA+-type ATPase